MKQICFAKFKHILQIWISESTNDELEFATILHKSKAFLTKVNNRIHVKHISFDECNLTVDFVNCECCVS